MDVFLPRWLGHREDVAIKLMGLFMSEREREKDQEVRVWLLLILGMDLQNKYQCFNVNVLVC